MDINSESFAALPPELQHDLLLEKKETEKYSHTHPSALPTVNTTVHMIYLQVPSLL